MQGTVTATAAQRDEETCEVSAEVREELGVDQEEHCVNKLRSKAQSWYFNPGSLMGLILYSVR